MQHDRLDFIDTLRAVAAVAVIAYHLPLVADGGPLIPSGWLDRTLLVFGASGVDLFFCISGFVLCLMAPHYAGYRHPVLAFYVKRLLRIAPLFFVVLAAWIVMFWASHRPVDWWQIAAEVTFLFNLFPPTAGGFAFADWTIGVEMLFYAAFPLLIRLVPGPGRKLVALLVAFPAFELVMLGYQALPIAPELIEPMRWLSVFHHAPSFLLGMLVYDLHRLPPATKHAGVLVAVAVMTAVRASPAAWRRRSFPACTSWHRSRRWAIRARAALILNMHPTACRFGPASTSASSIQRNVGRASCNW